MKIDIEGFEHRAFRQAGELFDAVYIPYVIMEWNTIKHYADKPLEDEDHELLVDMVEFFTQRNYVPRTPTVGKLLKTTDYKTWPFNIAWVKSYY
jgi:hypothetical protein